MWAEWFSLRFISGWIPEGYGLRAGLNQSMKKITVVTKTHTYLIYASLLSKCLTDI